jgi:hypothetical protein
MMVNRAIALFLFIVPNFLFSQTANVQWQATSPDRTSQIKAFEDLMLPLSTHFYHVDFDALNHSLLMSKRSEKTMLQLPIGQDGAMVNLNVIYSPIMGKGDQVKFKEIKTYVAYSEDKPFVVGRIGISSEGFYGIFDMENKQMMIRSSDNDRQLYAVYNLNEKLALLDFEQLIGCGTESSVFIHPTESSIMVRDEERKMRHFTIAISCTSGFADKVGNTENQVMAKVVQTLNLLNHRYNIDFGIRLNLMDSTSQLFNLDAQRDYFFNQTVGLDLLQQNQDFLDSLVDNTRYDLAQVFTKTCSDVGGVVWGRACNNNNKARGVSCRSNDEDYFFTTFKHEVGHQFSGGHTFNACNGSTQYNPNSSFEPGAGSTILSYGNNCGADNVGERTDYFHVANIIEVSRLTEELENTCGSWGADINHNPKAKVLSPKDKTIPMLTPFELEGLATDVDNDNLTYNWEQYDLGEGEPLGENYETGPLFVSVLPNSSGTRLFPNLSIINSGVSSILERLPEVSRELNFKLTVRDNVALIGGHDIASYKFNATDQAGPFRFTFPNVTVDTSFLTGQYVEFTWDVANTNLPPVDCKAVNIILSTTDGLTWSDTLVANTPNDGREFVMLPKTTSRARFKIKGADNIFLDISPKTIKVKQPATPGYSLDILPHDVMLCRNSTTSLRVKSVAWRNYEHPIQLIVLDSGHPDLVVKPSKPTFLPGEEVSLNLDATTKDLTGDYEVKLMSIAEQGDTLFRSIYVSINDDNQVIPGFNSPEDHSQNIPNNPVFSWKLAINSLGYQFQLADNPNFNAPLADRFGPINKVSDITNLPEGVIYYWRVRSLGQCGFGRWSELRTFRTVADLTHNVQVVNNVQLNIRTNESKPIQHPELFCQSVENKDEILHYTVVSLPRHGILIAGNKELVVGDIFTQADIDNGQLTYSATEKGYQGKDFFLFLAYDYTNSFVGPEEFIIDVNDSNPSGTSKVDRGHSIEVVPNPSSGMVELTMLDRGMWKDAVVRVVNMQGYTFMSKKVVSDKGRMSIDLSSLHPGQYIIIVESGNYIAKKRVVKI